MGTCCLLFLVLVPFFCSTGELFFFFFSTAVAFVCSGWHVWLFMVGGEGSSPASKHVTALYFVFHSEGRVLWQIFWRLINFLLLYERGREGERDKQINVARKKWERVAFHIPTLLLFLYSMKTHCIWKYLNMDHIARSSNAGCQKHTVCNRVYCVGYWSHNAMHFSWPSLSHVIMIQKRYQPQFKISFVDSFWIKIFWLYYFDFKGY